MATFESTLGEILVAYEKILSQREDNVAMSENARADLMCEAFQSREAYHLPKNAGSTYYLPGPGLCSLHGRKSQWNAQATQYVDRQGRGAFVPKDNGLISFNLSYDTFSQEKNKVKKCSITFAPGLLLPERGEKNKEFYTLVTEERALHIRFEAGEGSYHLPRGEGIPKRADWIGVKMSLSKKQIIHSVTFTPAVLENNVLSHFLSDVGYDGLDRLVK